MFETEKEYNPFFTITTITYTYTYNKETFEAYISRSSLPSPSLKLLQYLPYSYVSDCLLCPAFRPILLDMASEESIQKAYERISGELAAEGIPFIGLVNNVSTV